MEPARQLIRKIQPSRKNNRIKRVNIHGRQLRWQTKTRYTVIGAGHGGKTMAAHLALMDFPTTLYNRTPEHIYAIQQLGGIELENPKGNIQGFGKLQLCHFQHARRLLKKLR